VFTAGSTSFMRLWLHRLMRFRRDVCPFPSRGVKVEEMIKWVVEEVKTVLILFGS
jgi:hypothetical protein